MPSTEKVLPFGGEVRRIYVYIYHSSFQFLLRTKISSSTYNFQDICRCLLWIQRHNQNWPQIRTDVLAKPIDMLMLNQLKESCCEIKVSWILSSPSSYSLGKEYRS